MKTQTIRRSAGALLTVLILSAAMAGCTIKAPSGGTTVRITRDFRENELFYLENELCTSTEAKLFLMNLKNLYSERYGEEIWQSRYEGQPLYSFLENDLRDFLVELKCMRLMAGVNHVSISDEDRTLITLAATQYVRNLSKGEQDYCGGTYQDIETAFSDYYLANKLYRTLTADATREISDDEARVITVQMIYLPYDGKAPGSSGTAGDHTQDAAGEGTEPSGETEPAPGGESAPETEGESESGAPSGTAQSALELITELHRRATQDEEDFLGLAQSYSRGDWIERQICRGETEPAFEEAAFALSSGVISKVVEGKDGYYLIRCVSNYEPEPTETHRRELIDRWKKDIFETAYNEFVADLYLRFNDAAWKEIDFAAVPSSSGASFYSSYAEFLGE